MSKYSFLHLHVLIYVLKGMIVYVNYGRESDFRWLADQGINVSGHIAMARYGKGGRSGKVRHTEEGAVLYCCPQILSVAKQSNDS